MPVFSIRGTFSIRRKGLVGHKDPDGPAANGQMARCLEATLPWKDPPCY